MSPRTLHRIGYRALGFKPSGRRGRAGGLDHSGYWNRCGLDCVPQSRTLFRRIRALPRTMPMPQRARTVRDDPFGPTSSR
jgi:hypothetical protein